MIMASVEIIQYSIVDIQDGLAGDLPYLEVTTSTYVTLLLGIGLKFVLYVYCTWSNTFLRSDSMAALSEDHLNDVVSNAAAILSVSIAFNYPNVWWFDPLGAIVISLAIIGRWFAIIFEQVKKIVGHTAPPEFIEKVRPLTVCLCA